MSFEQQGVHAASEKEQPVIQIETTSVDIGELPQQSRYELSPRGGGASGPPGTCCDIQAGNPDHPGTCAQETRSKCLHHGGEWHGDLHECCDLTSISFTIRLYGAWEASPTSACGAVLFDWTVSKTVTVGDPGYNTLCGQFIEVGFDIADFLPTYNYVECGPDGTFGICTEDGECIPPAICAPLLPVVDPDPGSGCLYPDDPLGSHIGMTIFIPCDVQHPTDPQPIEYIVSAQLVCHHFVCLNDNGHCDDRSNTVGCTVSDVFSLDDTGGSYFYLNDRGGFLGLPVYHYEISIEVS